MTPETAAALAREMEAPRRDGRVECRVRARRPPPPRPPPVDPEEGFINALATELRGGSRHPPVPADPWERNFLALEDEEARLLSAWIELDRAAARARLVELIGTDLAYGLQQLPPAQAEALADRFLAGFAADARWFTRMERHFMTASNQEGTLAALDGAQVCVLLFTSDNPGR